MACLSTRRACPSMDRITVLGTSESDPVSVPVARRRSESPIPAEPAHRVEDRVRHASFPSVDDHAFVWPQCVTSMTTSTINMTSCSRHAEVPRAAVLAKRPPARTPADRRACLTCGRAVLAQELAIGTSCRQLTYPKELPDATILEPVQRQFSDL